MKKKTLKAGTYFVGDPCYLFEESWDKILEETDYLNDNTSKILGHDYFCDNTAHGDGCFEDQFGYKYPVDAGMIGCVPIELMYLDKKIDEDEIPSHGKLVVFEEDFVCTSDGEGYFCIGGITIDTDCYDEYPDQEDEFYDEGEDGWEDED